MKSLILLGIAILLTQTVFAQTALGVKGGLNVVNMAFGSPSIVPGQHQYRLSYHAGIYAQSALTDRLSVRSELLFSNKGFQFNDAPARSNTNLYYLSLPIIAQYRVWNQLSVVLGPEVSYLLRASAKTDDGRVNVSSFWNRAIDLGITAGIHHLINEKVEVGLRYTHGLFDVVGEDDITHVDEPDPAIEALDWKSQNRVFQLSVGYRLQ